MVYKHTGGVPIRDALVVRKAYVLPVDSSRLSSLTKHHIVICSKTGVIRI